MKWIFCLWASLCLCVVHAQTNNIRPLSIGDTLPAGLVLTNVLNYPASEIRLSDLKGKLVILDFWSSWCGACISLFPYMDSLQQRFKDNVQVILINTKSKTTKDDEVKIKKILERVRARTGSSINLPVAYNCDELDSYFPCVAIPHEVWINKNGIVTAITSSEEVAPANIQALLNDINIQLPLKKDRFSVDINSPLFVNGNGGDGKETIFRSLLTAKLQGISGGIGLRQNGDTITGFYAINQSLLALIKLAFGKQIPYKDNRIITDKPAKYAAIYSYELVLPPVTKEQLSQYMQDDLWRYFRISVKRETRYMKCLALRCSGQLKPGSAGKLPDLDVEKNTLKKYIYNYSPGFVVDLLNDYSPIPLIDETNLAENISIDLPFTLTDIPALTKAFGKIGLLLKEEERYMDVIVISGS